MQDSETLEWEHDSIYTVSSLVITTELRCPDEAISQSAHSKPNYFQPDQGSTGHFLVVFHLSWGGGQTLLKQDF